MSKNKKQVKPKSKPVAKAAKPKKVVSTKANGVASKSSKMKSAFNAVTKTLKGAADRFAKKPQISEKTSSKTAKVPPAKVAAKTVTKGAAPVQTAQPGKELKKGAATPAPKLESKKFCVITGCKNEATTEKYCRIHYMMAFQASQLVQKKDAQTKIKDMLDSLSEKFPDEYMDMIKADMASDENFSEAVEELEIEAEVDIVTKQ